MDKVIKVINKEFVNCPRCDGAGALNLHRLVRFVGESDLVPNHIRANCNLCFGADFARTVKAVIEIDGVKYNYWSEFNPNSFNKEHSLSTVDNSIVFTLCCDGSIHFKFTYQGRKWIYNPYWGLMANDNRDFELTRELESKFTDLRCSRDWNDRLWDAKEFFYPPENKGKLKME